MSHLGRPSFGHGDEFAEYLSHNRVYIPRLMQENVRRQLVPDRPSRSTSELGGDDITCGGSVPKYHVVFFDTPPTQLIRAM